MAEVNRLPVPLAIVAGAVVGAGGFWVADNLLRRPEPPPAPALPPAPDPVLTADLRRLEQAMAELQARLARLESRPALEAALDDPGIRDRLAAIVAQRRPPAPAGPRRLPAVETWRGEMAAGCREEYAGFLQEIRGVVRADEAGWNALRPVFDAHFAPVEAALRELEIGKAPAPPRIGDLVRPGLPATLDALRRALAPEAWAAFDAWRRSGAGVVGWYATRADYFLGPEELPDFKARHTAAIHWPVLRGELDRFYAKTNPEEARRGRLEAILRAHLDRLSAALRDEDRPDLASPGVMERVRPLGRETEARVGELLGAGGLAAFREWEMAAGGCAGYYFGRPPRPWIGDLVTRTEEAELYVDVDGRKPNLLVADGKETTEIVFRDLRRRKGLRVRFSTDSGRVDAEVKTTDDRGVARAVYTADTRTSTATVEARVLGDGKEPDSPPLATYVFNEAFDFRDLSRNPGLAGYNDETFVRSDAMTREQVQAFLEKKGSFLASYSEGGRSAAEIIKAAADKHRVNPKVILVTLQKEQSLVTRREKLAADAPEMANALGVRPRLARTFAAQVDVGTRVLRQRFDEPVGFFPIRVREKFGEDGRITQAFRDGNHIYVVPSTCEANIWAPVAFEPANRSTHAQHRYTNYVTHRPDAEAKRWPLPCGGVHLFVSTWRNLIGE